MPEEKTKENDNNRGMVEQDLDKGYSWIILSGSFFVYLFVLGSMKCFGVLYTEMLDHFSEGSGNTAWIGSTAFFLLLGLAPLTNALTRRFSFRLVSFIGGIMVGCGYFLSGFVKRMELMYLTFTLAGVGYGLSYTSAVTIINFYFKKRRALANGVMASSGGIAALSFPFLYRFLIDKYGLSQAFWIIGAILSNISVASCVFRQPKSLLKVRELPLPDSGSNGQHRVTDSCCNTLNLKFSLFKNRRFTLLVIAVFLCTIGHLNNYIIIPAHIKALGYDNTYVAFGVSINGGTELIARIVVGWFADLNIIAKIHIFVICIFVGGALALISPLFDNFTFMAVYSGVAAAFPASYLVLMSVLTIDRVGMESFQPAFAFISVFMAISSLVGLPTSGWLADYYGNWYPSFTFTGVTFICAGATALVEKVNIRFGMNKKYSLEKETRMSSAKDETHSKGIGMELVSEENFVQCNMIVENTKHILKNQDILDNEHPTSAYVGNDNPSFQKK